MHKTFILKDFSKQALFSLLIIFSGFVETGYATDFFSQQKLNSMPSTKQEQVEILLQNKKWQEAADSWELPLETYLELVEAQIEKFNKNHPYMPKVTLYDADPAHKPISGGPQEEDQDRIYCFIYKGN